MKIGLVGASYVERSLPFDSQRTINLYPVSDPQGADVASLYGTPGLTLFGTAGSGPARGNFNAANARAFEVSGNALYEVLTDGTTTLRGTLSSSSGMCTIEENGLQLAICDKTYLYIFTYATNVFAKVTDADLPSVVGGVDFVDGYFVVNQSDTGKFFISALYDGTSWNALDFATAESSPDKLTRAVNFIGQLGLFGERTLEIWRNTGDSSFPFARISGSTPIGCNSPDTIKSIDTSIYWVGRNDEGSCIVYKAQGFTPTRISTSPIERILQAVADPTLLYSWHYQQDGHVFYVISGSTLETSLVYDLSTQLWHERSYLNNGVLEQHLGSCCMFAFNKHLVGDRTNGNIYQLTQSVFDDNSNAILRRRVYTHLIDEAKPTRYSSLNIGFETGVGLQSGQGSSPLVSLRISKDGARTWSNSYTTSIGATGRYGTEVAFRRLGISQQNTFEISYTEPTKCAITGSYLT